MALPLSLLYPILGEFVDDAENYLLMPDDVPCFLAFVEAMVNVYKVEDSRRDTVLSISENHKMYIKLTLIGKFSIDVDLSSGKFRFSIFEFKNEIRATAAEPFCQTVLYYLEAMQKFAGQHCNSILPCSFLRRCPFLIPASFYLIPFRPLCRICECCMDRSSDCTDVVPCHPLPLSGYQYQDGEHTSAPPWSSPCAMHFIDTYYQEYRTNPCVIQHIHTQPLLYLGMVWYNTSHTFSI